MNDSGRKRGSKWDSKEDTHHPHSSLNSYHRDKESEPEPVHFNADKNSSRRSAAQNNHNSYYSEQDETRQQCYHRSGNRSNSRSRSPVYRSRRDTGVSPLPIRERGGDYCWEDNKIRKPRETKYHTDDFRERTMVKCVRSFDTDDDGASDPRFRRHRNIDGEGEFHRSSDIPCKFFAAGFCRNGKHCRFSHHDAERKQPLENNNFYHRHDNNNHNNKWDDVERLDNGKFGDMEVSRASKRIPEAKGNGSSWIDNMEMSPDWNYSAESLKDPNKEEQLGAGMIGQSLQSRVLKDNTATEFEQKKPIAPVQAFNHNTQNHNGLLYQSSLTTGGSQQVVAADLQLGSNLSNLENGRVYQDNHHSIVEKPVMVQNTVTKEQIDQISSISATIAQFLANGQPIPHLQQALQMTIQPNQATTALHTQSNSMSNQLWGHGASTGGEGVPVVNNIDKSQELTGNPKAYQENGEKKTDEASRKEEEGKKTEEDTNDAENVVDEDEDDDGSDEENEKGKDPKGMRAFKFALVEIVKELLKPAWREGRMKKDGYKNIVKKVVEKVTGTMQTGNVPQTQDKIDHYLTASKPKLTKLVQAYISKVKKN